MRWGDVLYDILLTAMIVIAILLILVVIVQPSKNNPSNLTSSDASVGKRKKARGFEAAMNRFTVVLGFVFMVIALLIAKISS